MPEKVTRLINSKSGEFQCKVCGATFFSRDRPIIGTEYYASEQQCPNGCKLDPCEKKA